MAEIPPRFVELVQEASAKVAKRALNSQLSELLAEHFPPDGGWFAEMSALCLRGCDEGWLCAREQAGVKYGRPVKASPATHGFSVDVVTMDSMVGPHHRHPNGEIDMVIPIDPSAEFDGVGRGWKVYEPDSAHSPTVRGGKAVILYLLPEGKIEFTSG